MSNHVIIENQTLFDVAIMYYGNIDGIFDIIKTNSNDIDFARIGDQIKVNRQQTNDFAKYYEKHTLEATTGTEVQSPPLPNVVSSGNDTNLQEAQTIQNGGFNATLSNLNTIENGN
jgi:hypothetical protein